MIEQNKLLSFSLYGEGKKYCVGMIKNVKLSNEIYPGWKVRVYLDASVPEVYVKELLGLGADVIDMSHTNVPGMYWRFLPLDDKTVDVFAVRDADSRLSNREKLAVDEWLSTDRPLHVMRDHPHHGNPNYPIMGGMWGYNNTLARWPISERLQVWLKNHLPFRRMDDMEFLNQLYYSHENQRVTHDDWLRSPKAQPFPLPRTGKRFVGEIFDENDTPGPQCELL